MELQPVKDAEFWEGMYRALLRRITEVSATMRPRRQALWLARIVHAHNYEAPR